MADDPLLYAEPASYHVLGELGRGGQAVIKLAVPELRPDELVVLKAPHEDMVREQRFARMLATEARVMTRMVHSNICAVKGLRNFNDALVMEMEYLRGQTMRSVQSRSEEAGGFGLNMRLRVIYRVLEALDYAHRLEGDNGRCLNVVHQDISPHNIFITYEGEIKILDFGIARLSESGVSATTDSLKGKLAYMAPEQLNPNSADHRTDIFAVGIILWEALAGRRMWQDLAQKEVLNNLALGSLPDIVEVNPAVPSELAQLCRWAISPEPSARPQTARILGDELRAYLTKTNRVVGDVEVGHCVASIFATERSRMSNLVSAELRKLKPRRSSKVPGRDRRKRGRSTPPRVMVIDDSELSRSLMAELLEESGIAVIALPSALDAVRIALEKDIRLIITDVNMPRLPGPELVRQIRMNPKARDIRIFLTSALSMDSLGSVNADGLIAKDRLEDELVPLVLKTLSPSFGA